LITRRQPAENFRQREAEQDREQREDELEIGHGCAPSERENLSANRPRLKCRRCKKKEARLTVLGPVYPC
jgi:hypothetical protein